MAGESIYAWIAEAPPPPEKAARYTSKFDGKARVEATYSSFAGATRPKATGSMGREVRDTVKPGAFMKAGAKTAALDLTRAPLPAKFERPAEARKPAVPKRDEAPVHGLTTAKDYVMSNAVEAILAVPKAASGSAARPAGGAGAAGADWLAKEDYGRVPAYLAGVKSEIEAEHEYIQSLLDQQAIEEEAASGTRMRELTMEERADLVGALKRKWDEVNHSYQRVTFKKISTSNSTIGEIRFKENCERTLAQLEKDIARLSVKAPIFVADDPATAAAAAAAASSS